MCKIYFNFNILPYDYTTFQYQALAIFTFSPLMINESVMIGYRRFSKWIIVDGWAKSDVEYVWKDGNPVQLAGNLSLPGGFKLGAFGSEYCDVVTATGLAF